MAYTVQQVVDLATKAYADLNDTEALAYANEAWLDICRAVEIVTSSLDVSITAGQREYDLADAILKGWSANYYVSADSWFELQPTNKGELDASKKGWRAHGTGIPKYFYLSPKEDDTGKIVMGLYPTPNTTSVGGPPAYPLIKLVVTKTTTLSLATTLPEALDTRHVLAAGIRAKHAYDGRHEGWQDEAIVFNQLIAELQHNLHSLVPSAPPTVAPGVQQTRRRR